IDEQRFRVEAGLFKEAEIVGNRGIPLWGRVWREPAIAIIAFEAQPIAGSSNQILESARARVSLRIVPDQDPEAMQDALVRHFQTRVPWGLEVNVVRETAASWWITEPKGPAFDAAARALESGYGRSPLFIGCGGTIPFVEPFARELGGVPAILTGVEDPGCN